MEGLYFVVGFHISSNGVGNRQLMTAGAIVPLGLAQWATYYDTVNFGVSMFSI